jgi:replication-associated recombination protein RarA
MITTRRDGAQQPLVEKYRPTTLDGFVGLDKARAVLRKLVENPYSSAWLLLGPSGLGKTTMARAIADAIGGQLHHVPSRSCDLAMVDKIVSDCRYTPWQGRWHVVLVDEADQMSAPAQLAFLSVLDGTAPPPDTIFLFTANATAKLADRFLSRVRKVQFEASSEPAIDLLERVWKAEIAALPEEVHEVRPPDFKAILQAANGNIRTALMTLEVELFVPGTFEFQTKTETHQMGQPAKPAAKGHADPRLPPVGTVLSREFQSRTITVKVLDQGFQFGQRRYTSLSAIAKEIAGGNRNGFQFFGLGAPS